MMQCDPIVGNKLGRLVERVQFCLSSWYVSNRTRYCKSSLRLRAQPRCSLPTLDSLRSGPLRHNVPLKTEIEDGRMSAEKVALCPTHLQTDPCHATTMTSSAWCDGISNVTFVK